MRGSRACAWDCAAFLRASEDVMVARDILLAELTGARFMSRTFRRATRWTWSHSPRRAALAVTCEATPHHFSLTDDDMPPYDSNYKMKPPLRSECDLGAVRRHRFGRGGRHRHRSRAARGQRENAGVRKMSVRRHRPRNRHRPGPGTSGASRQDSSEPHGGTVQHRACARLEPQRGRLSRRARLPTSRFSNLERAWTYDVNKSASKSRNSPFDGHAFRGGPVATVVNGRIVWRAENLEYSYKCIESLLSGIAKLKAAAAAAAAFP